MSTTSNPFHTRPHPIANCAYKTVKLQNHSQKSIHKRTKRENSHKLDILVNNFLYRPLLPATRPIKLTTTTVSHSLTSVMLQILLLVLLTSQALPQVIPVWKCDQILSDTNEAMKSYEKDVADVISTSIPDVQALSGTVVPSLSTSASDYAAGLEAASSIENFGDYQNVTACADINLKITGLTYEVSRMRGLYTQAVQNLTRLQEKFNYVSYFYTISYFALSGAEVATYVAVLKGEWNFFFGF